jgi:gamma-glutamyl-gamma-aminobutyrate hydrolase PuuD
MKNNTGKLIYSSLLFLFSLAILSCSKPKDESLRIAVSKLSANYENWLLQSDSTLVISNLYGKSVDSAVLLLESHHGLLLTGGEDVFPDWYGMIHDTARCGEFDRYRDTLEIMLIRKAMEMNIPILGICRGHQILNVTFGGTLIIDIPEDIGTEVIHRCPEDPFGCHHEVMAINETLLQEITGLTAGTVNTNHHQAVKDLAPGLRISAVSFEGLVEAIEWEEYQNRPFLLGVQWHPERMEDYPELSRPIAERFIQEVRKYTQRAEILN